MTLVATALGLLTWAWSEPDGGACADSSWQPRDPDVAESVSASAAALAVPLVKAAGSFCGNPPHQSIECVALRMIVLARAVWVFVLGTSAAVLAGLAFRESARTTLRFASPTWNYLGKRLAASAFAAGLTGPLLPLAVPAWTPYVAFLFFALGVTVYVANLPVKL